MLNVSVSLNHDQLQALLSRLDALILMLGGDDPAKLAALTEQLKKSGDALTAATNQQK